ncbi:hypothetical protein ACFSYD_15030 [Paracoccus aerius]
MARSAVSACGSVAHAAMAVMTTHRPAILTRQCELHLDHRGQRHLACGDGDLGGV